MGAAARAVARYHGAGICAMIATQTGAFLEIGRVQGDVRVHIGSIRSGAWAALAIAVALGGCANVDLSPSGGWFQKPVDLFGRSAGYTYSELGESRKQQRPITANDLVDANGTCPPPAAPQPQPAAAPGRPASPGAHPT